MSQIKLEQVSAGGIDDMISPGHHQYDWRSSTPSTHARQRYCAARSLMPVSHGTGTLWCLTMMSHIVESCPPTKLNGGLSWLHSAAEDAVSWLTSYGSSHAYEKKKSCR